MQNTTKDNKLSKKLRRQTGKAIEDFQMIQEGERIMVCVSGGKDSFTLLDILQRLRDRAPVSFSLFAIHLNQNQPNFPVGILQQHLETTGIPYEIIDEDTYSIVKRVIPEGKTMCGLCSRLRRGIFYRYAKENNFSRIALGHHSDDMIETLFLNMFYGGRIKSMPPKLVSDDGMNTVIRPLAYCREKDIIEFSNSQNYPIIPCNLCGSQEHLKRKQIKSMIKEWEKKYPGRVQNIIRSISHVTPSHMADRELFDFKQSEGSSRYTWLPEGKSESAFSSKITD